MAKNLNPKRWGSAAEYIRVIFIGWVLGYITSALTNTFQPWVRWLVCFVVLYILGLIYGRYWQTFTSAYRYSVNRAGTGAGTGIAATASTRTIFTRSIIPRDDPELGEIIAYRVWKISKAHSYLTSLFEHNGSRAIWPPNEPMTGEPDDYGNAGVYSWKTMRSALEHNDGYGVIGRVKLWGEIIEHEKGYRAQYARVYAIDHVNVWHSKHDGPKEFTKTEAAFAADRLMLKKLRRLYNVEGVKSELNSE